MQMPVPTGEFGGTASADGTDDAVGTDVVGAPVITMVALEMEAAEAALSTVAVEMEEPARALNAMASDKVDLPAVLDDTAFCRSETMAACICVAPSPAAGTISRSNEILVEPLRRVV